jgi:hypothetical protein
METSKKYTRGGKSPANGDRLISARLANGNLIGQQAQTKWSKEKVWDASFFNFHTNKWEPEGEPRTYRQAYARATYLRRHNPYCEVGVILMPGYSRIKKTDLAPVAEVAE